MPSEDRSPPPSGFLSKTGNYRDLLSYRKSEIIYDFTFRFCQKFLSRGDRTVDQMVQAARSGKQNIAEGSKAARTSTKTEITLTNVARASLEELPVDYQDFLRVRDLPVWPKTSKEALYARKLGKSPDESFETYRPFFEDRPAAVLANIALCLIHQANYLLDQQIRRLEKDFVKKGGIR
jgi:four helix bundle suffix protein